MNPAITNPEGGEKHRSPAGEKVYDHIKQAIFDGRYKPGERLGEESLARETGVSRTPVRSALSRLATEGLIKPLGKRGYCHAGDSLEEMEELFELRAVLEGFALGLVARKISKETLKELDRYLARAKKALARNDIEEVFKWNTEFHDALTKLIADRPRLHSLISDMRKYVLRYRKDTLLYLKGAERSIEGHCRIMHALMLGCPDICEKVMRDHIREAKEDAYHTVLEQKELMKGSQK